MRNISINTKGLKFFGLNILTGEACSYSMRNLYDVSERGRDHFEAFIGGKITIADGSNWNSGFVERKEEEKVKAVGSIMLPSSCYGFIKDFLIFCALQEGYHVIAMEGSIEIIKDIDKWREAWREIISLIPDDREYSKAYKIENKNSNGRNRHQMSGRDT